MTTLELFERLGVALAVGLVIGLERGWQQRTEREGERAAGLRTYALSGLLGGVWGAVASAMPAGGVIALALAFVAFSACVLVFRLREAINDRTFGATTQIAAMLAFALGALAVIGDMAAAAAGGVAVAALLSLKPALHAWLQRLTWLELRSALVLLAMTFLLLPILPNRAIDRLGAINPYEIWLLTVLIAVISFAGYVAIKVTGEQRGVALTGLTGGLASSTATTLTLARLAAEHPTRSGLLAGGALISAATMMVRVLAVTAIAKAALLGRLGLPLILSAALMAGAGVVLVQRSAGQPGNGAELSIANPLDLAAVLRFSALLTAVGVVAQIATSFAGGAGALTVAALAGLADVDAITLSMARLAGGGLSNETAAMAILLAVAVNTATKTALGWTTGGRDFGWPLAITAIAALLAAAVGLLAGPLPLDKLGLL